MAKERIMVVEDEGVVALQIKEALQSQGYVVPLVVLTGEEAVAQVLETEPDLVLMDIQLKGGLSGIEAAQRIRQRLDVPVVYLTAFSDSETLAKAQLTEPYGYVLKPFEEKGLHAIIQMSLLKHRRSRDLREKGWWMSAVAASMVEAVVICDPKSYIKFVNPSAEALLGRAQSALLEKRLQEVIVLIDSESRAPLSFPVSEPLLEGKSTMRGDCRLVAGEGREFPVEFSAAPLRSPEGTLFGVMYVFRETSDRERIQHLLVHELEELARVQKRVLPSKETVIPGIRSEWLFLPATFGGGDALGIFRLDDKQVGFYALDVVGQGIFSSLFSLLLHTFLSPHVDRGGMLVEKICEEPRRRILSPAEVVKESASASSCATTRTPISRSSTASSIRQRVPPAWSAPATRTRCCRRAAWCRWCGRRGTRSAFSPGSDVATEELRLDKGDRLFLYSDGLVDCTNKDGARFTSGRLVELITAGKTLPLAELLGSLREKIVQWRGSESFADDVSLLALEKE